MTDIEEEIGCLARNYLEGQTFGKWSNRESKLVSLLLVFDAQVLNGGLLQWYGNPCGGFLKETVHRFELVGCIEIAERLQSYFGRLEFSSYEDRSLLIDGLLNRPKDRLAIIEGFDYWYENQREQFMRKLLEFLQENRPKKNPENR